MWAQCPFSSHKIKRSYIHYELKCYLNNNVLKPHYAIIIEGENSIFVSYIFFQKEK